MFKECMNKTITTPLPRIFLLLLSLATDTLSAAEHQSRPCIIDLDRPTDRTVYFANDPQPHLYPEEITNQLVMVQEATTLGLRKPRVVDLSHTPDLTKEKFNALVALMHKPENVPVYDQIFLDTLTAADTLLEENNPIRIMLLEKFMRNIIKKHDFGADNIRQYFEQFNNHLAELFNQELKKRALQDSDSIFRRVNLDTIIPRSSSYYWTINKYTINTLGETSWILEIPTPNYKSGKPDIRQLEISIQDLIDANKMPLVIEIVGPHILYLCDACLTSLRGLPCLPNLSELYLDNNCLTHIPKHAFTNTPNLTRLRLECNSITDIDDEAFVGLKELNELRLNNNKLTIARLCAFAPLVKLKDVNLSDNNITIITREDETQTNTVDCPPDTHIWRPYKESRYTLDLDGNPILSTIKKHQKPITI